MITMLLGQTPIESKNHVESIGMAVFKDDVLIGELNNIEKDLKIENVAVQDIYRGLQGLLGLPEDLLVQLDQLDQLDLLG